MTTAAPAKNAKNDGAGVTDDGCTRKKRQK